MKGKQILGVVVSDEWADLFRMKLKEKGIDTTEAIQWFVWQIITDQMYIEREQDGSSEDKEKD